MKKEGQHASEDLRDAYDRLRATVVAFGEQRIDASHHCIMFARKACYFFVRPKRDSLELCVFLGRRITAPQIKSATPSSKTKTAHIIGIRHRDEVEPPITGWLGEAYQLEDTLAAGAKPPKAKRVVLSRRQTATAQRARPRARATKR